MPDCSKPSTEFNAHVAFRCPPAPAAAIEEAAAQDMTTPSAYARQAIVKQLRRDGFAATTINPAPSAAA
jgi:hypothetical protein